MSQDLNRYLEDSVRKGHAGLKQVRLFVISCRARTVERAQDYFKSIETNLENNFTLLESRLVPLDGEQRLKFLFCFWNLGHAQVPDFTFRKLAENGIDFRDLIAPQMVRCDLTDTGGSIRPRCRLATVSPGSCSPRSFRRASVRTSFRN